MNVEFKILSSKDLNDFKALICVFELVFEFEDFKIPSDNHLQKVLEKSDFFVLVALIDNKVVGGLTVYVLNQYYSIKPLAYIYDVGILNNYQRKGIGKKLMSYLTNYCKENGFEEAYVEAELEDLDAINFYKSTPFSNTIQATHFSYLLYKR